MAQYLLGGCLHRMKPSSRNRNHRRRSSKSSALRKWANILAQGEEADPQLIAELKGCAPDVILAALANARRTLGHAPWVVGRIFPRDYSEVICRLRSTRTNNLGAELNWSTAVVVLYASELNRFISQKAEFDELVIRERHEEAENVLHRIKEQFGVSLWSIEAEMMVGQLARGFVGNREKLAEFQKECTNPIANMLAEFLSFRIERTDAVDNYHVDLRRFFQRQTEMIQHKSDEARSRAAAVMNNCKARLELLNPASSLDYEDIVYFDGAFGIIDRYLMLVRCLQLLFAERRSRSLGFFAFVL